MVVQAGPLLTDIPGKGLMAGGQVQSPADGVQGGAGLHAPAVGTEIFGAVLGGAADQGEFGVGLPAQPHQRIALVVLEQNVIAGHVLLDEGVFQDQGLEFAAHQDGVEGVHLPHHGVGLQIVAPPGLEILADPVFQLLGLAHIDDCARLVVHQVHAGGQGQAVGFFQQLVFCHDAASFP